MVALLGHAQRLKRIREFLGYSQRDLAQEFQVTRGAIAHWESGTRPIPGPVIKLMEIYEKSLPLESTEYSDITAEALEASRNLMKLSMEALRKEGFNLKPETTHHLKQTLDSFVFDIYSQSRIAGKVKALLFRQVLKSFEGSRGLVIKVVQLISFLELGIPTEVVDLLGDLQDLGKPMAASAVQEILKQAYGERFNDLFKHFSSTPIAVTSLAQIHRAQLKTGEEVVLKIRHHDIEDILNGQFKKLSFFAILGRFLGKKSEEILSDIQEQVMLETDYEREAFNQERFRNIFEHESRIVIPKIFRDLCRKNIIVSQYEDGVPFSVFRARGTSKERSQASLLIAYFHSFAIFKRSLMHADSHPGNFLFRKNQVIFLDFGRVIEYTPEDTEQERRLFSAILFKNKAYVLEELKQRGIVPNDASFDLDGFWKLLQSQQRHHLVDGNYKLNRSYIRMVGLEERNFRDRKKMNLDKIVLRASLVNVTLWNLFADLEADAPWRAQALEILNSKNSHPKVQTIQ